MENTNQINEIINTLATKIANLEIQNAAILAENNSLKTENKENDDNVTNK